MLQARTEPVSSTGTPQLKISSACVVTVPCDFKKQADTADKQRVVQMFRSTVTSSGQQNHNFSLFIVQKFICTLKKIDVGSILTQFISKKWHTEHTESHLK